MAKQPVCEVPKCKNPVTHTVQTAGEVSVCKTCGAETAAYDSHPLCDQHFAEQQPAMAAVLGDTPAPAAAVEVR